MSRYTPAQHGTVNIGVPTIIGKQSPNSSGQALMIPPEEFVSQKGQQSPAKMKVHERIKELIGQKNIPRREAVKIAHAESKQNRIGQVGTINQKDIYQHKFQAEQPGRQMSPFRSQEQETPFI